MSPLESELDPDTLGVQWSPSESEFEEEIFISMTTNKFSPYEYSGVGVQEEKKLNDCSPMQLVELEESVQFFSYT